MWAVSGVLILAACVGVSKTVTVTNTVNGKELPIYFVVTDEKKVALSLRILGFNLTENSK